MTQSATPEFAIDVRGMTKRFGKLVAADHIDLQVPRGTICGFLGPNGSGKTTFIRMLCGLLHADAGSGTCLGFDVIRDSEEIKRQVGYMTPLRANANAAPWKTCRRCRRGRSKC